ncbi:MAG: ABC transporter ATP-binding protein [Pseudomonadota bacterium]|nr:ABC transporter ATP-binding protein [Pseudomonadota bacterium]
MSPIELENVAKHWGESRALDGITFSAEPGSFVVLLGPSGCGKSTTLRLIAGLDTPTSGTIRIGGHDVTRLPPAARGLAMVFQSYALFPHLTVAENIVFGLRVRKVPDREAKLKRVAGILGLEALLQRKPSQLSGGQQQRVALGRAIIAEAKVCLMDEPLSNLDAQLRGEMRREIRALQQRLGITMVYVTHDQTEAMTMADRVVLLRGGRIEQVGSPEELYAHPATAFTASFIGAPPMNLMKLNGGEVVTGVRPEDMHLATEGIAGRVSSVEYLGADSLVAVDAHGQTMLVRVAGRAPTRAGDEVRVAWDRNHEHRFDPLTGGRKP